LPKSAKIAGYLERLWACGFIVPNGFLGRHCANSPGHGALLTCDESDDGFRIALAAPSKFGCSPRLHPGKVIAVVARGGHGGRAAYDLVVRGSDVSAGTLTHPGVTLIQTHCSSNGTYEALAQSQRFCAGLPPAGKSG